MEEKVHLSLKQFSKRRAERINSHYLILRQLQNHNIQSIMLLSKHVIPLQEQTSLMSTDRDPYPNYARGELICDKISMNHWVKMHYLTKSTGGNWLT